MLFTQSPNSLGMNLPQELLEEILGYIPYLPPYGTKSLQSCSLVSKSWAEPGQRILFASIILLYDFQNTIPPSSTLLRHVLSFACRSFMIRRYTPNPRPSLHTLRDYLSSFSQLRELDLYHMDI